MQKFNNSDIKTFQFSDLKSDHVLENSQFENFQFKEIDGTPMNREIPSDQTIRSERRFESQNDFKIDVKVRESRGLTNQEHSDFEKRVEDEVQRRIQQIRQDAFAEGLSRGMSQGVEKSQSEFNQSVAGKIDELHEVISQVSLKSSDLVLSSKNEIYEFIKRFTKWILLKEVAHPEYLEKLLEKLIQELNQKRNLIIKIGKANFSSMPDVIKAVESKLGELPNVRIEIVPEVSHPGIILESDNGLIDGSLETIFQNIDKIFELVSENE